MLGHVRTSMYSETIGHRRATAGSYLSELHGHSFHKQMLDPNAGSWNPGRRRFDRIHLFPNTRHPDCCPYRQCFVSAEIPMSIFSAAVRCARARACCRVVAFSLALQMGPSKNPSTGSPMHWGRLDTERGSPTPWIRISSLAAQGSQTNQRECFYAVWAARAMVYGLTSIYAPSKLIFQ